MSKYYPDKVNVDPEGQFLTTVSAQGPQQTFDRTLLTDYITTLGSNIITFLPFLESDPPITVLEVIDHGPSAHHFVNLVAFDNDPRHRGRMLAYRFNGADEGLSHADHADFTFGNGAADTAMSVGCWFNAASSAAAIEGLIGRYDSLVATNLEWRLFLDAAGKVNFVTHDDDVPASIGRLFNTAITDFTWYFVVATKSTGVTSAAINIYLAAASATSIAAVDDTDNAAGAYVAMEDKTVLTSIAYTVDAGAGNAEWFEGEMWGPFVVGEELSSATISTLFTEGKTLLGL